MHNVKPANFFFISVGCLGGSVGKIFFYFSSDYKFGEKSSFSFLSFPQMLALYLMPKDIQLINHRS